MIYLTPTALENPADNRTPPHYIRAVVNHLNLNWQSLHDGRVFSVNHCDLQDALSGERYSAFSMIPNARYVKNGRRYISNGSFEICLEDLIEYLSDDHLE